ncbi:AAA family ATPase [Mesorhizobium sp. ArgA1]
MFLRRLRLENIRSIATLDMSFEQGDGKTRPWTFLLGENGSGKSTVLRCIALVLSGSEALPEILGDHDWWIREGQPRAFIEVDIVTAKNEPRTARLEFNRGAGTFKFLTDNKQTLEELDAALSHASRNYFVVGYGVNRRAAPEGSNFNITSSMYRTTRSQAVATLFSASAALVSLEQWAIDLDYRRGEQGLGVVRQALDSLLPGVTFTGVDKERRKLRFNTPDGVLPLDLLSDGYQAMAAWCGDLLFRITETFKDYDRALAARGLLLIDELDLHLHPLWQRHLVDFLKTTLPKFQFVTTTHSPLTVHQAGEGELFVLRRQPENTGPSALQAFSGAPNRLMLHQLIQSPIFGLDTLDSPQVAQVRREIRVLKGLPASDSSREMKTDVQPAKTAAGRASQIRAREAQLSTLADRSTVPGYLQPTNKLLERIAAELESSGNAEGSRAKALQQVVKNTRSAKNK